VVKKERRSKMKPGETYRYRNEVIRDFIEKGLSDREISEMLEISIRVVKRMRTESSEERVRNGI